jgi:hypothetical protein
VNCTAEVVALALAAAEKLTCCGDPGVSVKVEGVAVTPAGTPLAATCTVPENPLSAVADTATVCALPPAARVTLVAPADKEKSGFAPGTTELDPQPATNAAASTNPPHTVCRSRTPESPELPGIFSGKTLLTLSRISLACL